MTDSKHYKQVTDDLRLAYDRKAEERNNKVEPDWKETERLAFLRLLEQEGKKRLLELGSGAGWDSLFFQEHGLSVISSDLSPEMVRLCRAKGRETGHNAAKLKMRARNLAISPGVLIGDRRSFSFRCPCRVNMVVE